MRTYIDEQGRRCHVQEGGDGRRVLQFLADNLSDEDVDARALDAVQT